MSMLSYLWCDSREFIAKDLAARTAATKAILVIIIVFIFAGVRKGARGLPIYWPYEWKFPVLDLRTLLEMPANVLHPLIPGIEMDPTETTLTWPVTVNRVAPSLRLFAHVFH